MVKLKVKVSHTIDADLIKWLDSEIKTRRFASRSHGLEYALAALKEEGQEHGKHKAVQ